MNTGFYGVVGCVSAAAYSGNGSGGNDGKGNGKGPNRNGSNNGNKPTPLEIAQAIIKWYEKNAERLANSQNAWVMSKKLEAEQEELESQGYAGLGLLAELRVKESDSKDITRKEHIAARAMRVLIRMNPELATTVYEIIRELEREHGFQSITATIYEAAKIRGYHRWHVCRYTCNACQSYAGKFVKQNGQIVRATTKRIPVTVIDYCIRKTGEVMKSEKIWGHRWVPFYADPVVYTEIERGYEEIPISEEEAKHLKKSGYCPMARHNKKLMLPLDVDPVLPQKAPDHFPQDLIGTLDGQGAFIDVKHSGKHGEETA